MHVEDYSLYYCNELFSSSIQDSSVLNINSTTSNKKSRKLCKTYLDKDIGLLYQDIWSIIKKLFEIYSSYPVVFM